MVVRKRAAEFKYTHTFLEMLFADDMHAKRVYFLANATLGVMTSASLAVCSIGRGLALAQGGLNKHAIKQVDRLLSNPGIEVTELAVGGWRWCLIAVVSMLATSTPVRAHHQPPHEEPNIASRFSIWRRVSRVPIRPCAGWPAS